MFFLLWNIAHLFGLQANVQLTKSQLSDGQILKLASMMGITEAELDRSYANLIVSVL